MTESYTLWARNLHMAYETPTSDQFDCSPAFVGHAFEYLRKRGARGIEAGAFAEFSIRDLSGMRIYESWVADARGRAVPRERRAPPEILCQEFLRGLSPERALAIVRDRDLKSPYWAKVREILETCVARGAKE
jgi:hypothetical protein